LAALEFNWDEVLPAGLKEELSDSRRGCTEINIYHDEETKVEPEEIGGMNCSPISSPKGV
jgi:hypothetical protein